MSRFTETHTVAHTPDTRTVGLTVAGRLHLVAPGSEIKRGGILTTLGGWPYATAVCNSSYEVLVVPDETRQDWWDFERTVYFVSELGRRLVDRSRIDRDRVRVCKRCTGLAFGQDLAELPLMLMPPREEAA